MIVYILKSTICLVILYGFFHFFLRQYKILIFNRIYLISSLVFSLIIPLIIIPVKSGFTINTGIRNLNLTTVHIIQSAGITVRSTPHISFLNIVFILFLAISGILLVRFAFNIFNLLRKINKCKKIEKHHTTLVLVNENIIPYSFFRYIFVNRQNFEEGKIERELLLHEEAHCLQYHSIDVIILEIINIFFWFNPAIWLFRKAIQLNHEYYADNRVLTNSDSEDYHQLLINLVIQNNTSYLVSNFKYSLIKNRLIMMTNSGPLHNTTLRKIIGVMVFLILGIAISCSQDENLKSNLNNRETEWYKPIFQKHNIDMNHFNFFSSFRSGPIDSIHISGFEIGNCDSIKKRNLTIKDPVCVLQEDGNGYSLITAKSATHDPQNEQITYENGTMESFLSGDEWMESPEFASYVKPGKKFAFDKLTISTKSRKVWVKNIKTSIQY